MVKTSAATFCFGTVFGLLLSSLWMNAWNLQLVMYQFDNEQLDMAITSVDPAKLTVEELPTSPLFCKDASSSFDKIADEGYQHLFHGLPNLPRQSFDLKTWKKATQGGLTPEDRILLARIYGQANSVFEYGLGESTYIADHVGVKRYAGIDSDPNWIAQAREKVSSSYRFYLADIGSIRGWGMPNEILSKQPFTYQLAPLINEPVPFDVYMVDGRFRFPCMLASFLHASARGAHWNKTTVLLHDCEQFPDPQVVTNRSHYHSADHLLDMVEHSGKRLCVYKRKPETTDEQLMEMWSSQKLVVY